MATKKDSKGSTTSLAAAEAAEAVVGAVEVVVGGLEAVVAAGGALEAVQAAAPGPEEASALVGGLDSVLEVAQDVPVARGVPVAALAMAGPGAAVLGVDVPGATDGVVITGRVAIGTSSSRTWSRTTSTRGISSRASIPTATGSARRTGSASTSARRTSTTTRRTSR